MSVVGARGLSGLNIVFSLRRKKSIRNLPEKGAAGLNCPHLSPAGQLAERDLLNYRAVTFELTGEFEGEAEQ
jgi:hypothetical protein